jgi:hypothetical protein
MLREWLQDIGLDWHDYGTHSMRRTKATPIYRQTKNLRAVQLLLGRSDIASTVRYFGIEVDDALEISAANKDVAAVLPENLQVCASIEAPGRRAVASTPEQFADQGRGETAKWPGVVARLRLHYGASRS